MKVLKQRYALDREIGRGASGRVWIAQDLQLGRRVALKVVDRDDGDDEGARARFEHEAWTIAQLSSPHIVRVFDSGVDDGMPFIVMELLHGESLEDRLQRHPKLPARIAAFVVGEIAKGLSASHAAGIIHRDLKPANVFLSRENGREIAKLLDFGIAALLVRPELNGALGQVVAGTPQYMSPEHFAGASIDHRADLWSLAVLAYQMLLGRFPFAGKTLLQLRDHVCSAAFLRPSEVSSDFDSALDAVFEQAFAKDAADRFQSASDLSTAVARFAGLDIHQVVRVLVVDDEPDMEILVRQWFRRELRSGRYELFFATSGEEGLEELSRRPDIDVVLTDINMPGMDGLTFLGKVPDVNPLVRVVVVSAYNDMANIRAAMNRGAFDFLCKPIDFEDLKKTAEKCAQHTLVLRRARDFHQENEILRRLVGEGVADRCLAQIGADGTVQAESTEGSVVVVGVTGWPEEVAEKEPAVLLARLNAAFDLVATEIAGRHVRRTGPPGARRAVLPRRRGSAAIGRGFRGGPT